MCLTAEYRGREVETLGELKTITGLNTIPLHEGYASAKDAECLCGVDWDQLAFKLGCGIESNGERWRITSESTPGVRFVRYQEHRE